MMSAEGVGELDAAELALRLNALRGTAAYAAYLAGTSDLERALVSLEEEIASFMPDSVVRISPSDGTQLIEDLTTTSIEAVIVDARSLSQNDWALVDRRRSSVAHRGVVVFVTTPASFADLMRSAPNLASWLGGEVFAYPTDGPGEAVHREQRLAALRAWASRTDDSVIEAARADLLPRDPEYAEWLVLLGHSDLIESDKR